MLEYDFVIYPRKLWIGTREECLNNFTNRDSTDLDLIDEDDYDALTITVMESNSTNFGYFIILKNKASASIIGHEATHVMLELCNEMDIVIDSENQEPIAYLMGYISKCIVNYEIN